MMREQASPPTLTSTANPRFRAALSLRDRRERARHGRLLVDGVREVARALDAGVALVEVFVAPGTFPEPALDAVVARAAGLGVPVVPVTADLLTRLAYGERASGIVAVATAPATSLEALRLPAVAPIVGVLEDVEKPGNLGAVCRSADGAGLDALIAASTTAVPADPWNPNAVRASLGTVFTLPLAVGSTANVLAWLRDRGLRAVAARVDGSVPYTEADLRGPVALVLGSEATGLTDAWSGADLTAVRLPMRGRADSLNVAAAAAVLFYEARRQRDAGA
ncbi:MAG: RNA methyltransferase [Candidatus Limnocylindrales bacterium]|jgi:RNA methyltransferase, TrmH family|nr:RNA methyltransferase [Candidatus Limnocylindrales bacterium]